MNTSNNPLRPHPEAAAPASRRALLRTAAWGTPAVLIAGASPAFAASTSSPQVNLYSLAANANESADGTRPSGVPYYEGPRTLTYTVTYGNRGPDVMPAGALIAIGLPHPAIWDAGSMRVTADPGGKGPVFTQQRTEFVTPATETAPAFNRSWFEFTLGQPIAVNESFSITYSITLTATSNTSSQGWSVRDFADIGVGGTNATETSTGDNRSRVEALRMYNP